ncbi:MAG TPA: EAL domain-containing protein [Candidatus Limnocylindria bacterium]|jgi:diguanylate cyclase (GGDEF)-like protein|nr:EAL domain-containing protein [Candidatus Limnocylindria bacterium]
MSERIPLRALLVEDSADDAELLARELRHAGYDLTYERVQDRAALEVALARGSWDVVFSDHTLPGFGSQIALRMVRGRDPDVPFIIVSGTMGEEVAVAAMHAGASDYFVKGKTRRLPAVLERELRQAAGRAARRELERAFAALRDVASAVGRLPEPVAVAAIAAKHARSLLNADAALLHAWDGDAGVLRLLSGDGAAEALRPGTLRSGEGASGMAFERREPVLVEDYGSWPLAMRSQADLVKSALAVPLVVGDRAIGALVVVSLKARSFTPDQVELLQLLASEVAPTLEAGRLFDEAERQRLEAEALAEAAKLVAAGTVARDALRSILTALQRVVATDAAALIVPEGGDAFRIVDGVGFPDHVIGRSFNLATGPVKRAQRTGAVQLAGDAEPAGPLQVRSGIRLVVAVPIERNEKIIATLAIGGARDRHFSVREIRLLQRFADQIAMALENDRLMAEAAAREADLERLAHFDVHTQLPNRTLFRDQLRAAIRTAEAAEQPLSVMLIDLDHFKDTNDAFGHEVGDAVLREIGPRLKRAVDGIDGLARFGGDEFAILLPAAGSAEILAMARRILEVFERPFSAFGQLLLVRASVGTATFPRDGADADALIRCMEVALETAKRKGVGTASYAPENDVYAPSRLALMAQLREAIEQKQLVLHYQPIVDLDRRPRVFEALVRWRHPQRGMVQPSEFIPLAERAGLMKPLTRWVMGEALRQCREWRDHGRPISVAVNLSMRTLHDAELPQIVRDLLRVTGCEPSALDLEITESDVMADPKGAIEILARLRALGVRVSIDDFGTGYSSLAYLNRLEVDEVKIDRSFVGTMVVDGSSAAIVRATIELGHGLGLEVVAEGVEDQETCDALRDLGCDRAQGYFFGRPMPAAEVDALLGAVGS